MSAEEIDSAHGRSPQREGTDHRPERPDRTQYPKPVADPQQPHRKREGDGRYHHQQRKVGDELELLGSMVQRRSTVGGTGEGVRVYDDKAIDPVGVRK